MVGRTPRMWRRIRRLANFLAACVLFLWIATTLLMRDSGVSVTFSSSGSGAALNLTDYGHAVIQENFLHVYTVPPRFEKYLAPPIPPHQTNVSSLNDTLQRVLTVRDIADAMASANAAQVIHNEAIFGPVDNSTIVIVVQVHARAEYLKHLVVSFAAAKDIETALIIFSHDLYDAEINDVISRIDFCRYAQIFFPLSIQTHPDHFPGDDPRDCPPDMRKASAEKLGCQNAKWPDKFGHYRQAKLSQIKHHWWWKAWHLFEGGFRALEGFAGDVIFLEEDHWVVEDFIPVYRLLKKEGKSWCPECSFISLGNYLKKQDRAGNQVEISQWISSKHNMGMAFGRDAWNVVKSCARQFCLFDDYNWDWSLMYIGMTCTQPKLMTLNLKSSRVFHIGECGIHHKRKNCDVLPVLNRVHAQIRTYGELYPKSLSFRKATYKLKAPKGNGGWGDYRDRALCLNITSPSFLLTS